MFFFFTKSLTSHALFIPLSNGFLINQHLTTKGIISILAVASNCLVLCVFLGQQLLAFVCEHPPNWFSWQSIRDKFLSRQTSIWDRRSLPSPSSAKTLLFLMHSMPERKTVYLFISTDYTGTCDLPNYDVPKKMPKA